MDEILTPVQEAFFQTEETSEFLSKGKSLPEGTTREWGGKTYVKTGGMWKPKGAAKKAKPEEGTKRVKKDIEGAQKKTGEVIDKKKRSKASEADSKGKQQEKKETSKKPQEKKPTSKKQASEGSESIEGAAKALKNPKSLSDGITKLQEATGALRERLNSIDIGGNLQKFAHDIASEMQEGMKALRDKAYDKAAGILASAEIKIKKLDRNLDTPETATLVNTITRMNNYLDSQAWKKDEVTEKKTRVSTESAAKAVLENTKATPEEKAAAKKKVDKRIRDIENSEGSRKKTDEKYRLEEISEQLEKTVKKARVSTAVTKVADNENSTPEERTAARKKIAARLDAIGKTLGTRKNTDEKYRLQEIDEKLAKEKEDQLKGASEKFKKDFFKLAKKVGKSVISSRVDGHGHGGYWIPGNESFEITKVEAENAYDLPEEGPSHISVSLKGSKGEISLTYTSASQFNSHWRVAGSQLEKSENSSILQKAKIFFTETVPDLIKADAKVKYSKEESEYKTTAEHKDSKIKEYTCDNCKYYTDKGGCDLVTGKIEAKAYCKFYEMIGEPSMKKAEKPNDIFNVMINRRNTIAGNILESDVEKK